MADISDVLGTLAGIVATSIYPNGTGAASAAGVPAQVYPGWPVPAQLDADLAAGKAHVSLWPAGAEQNTTRYLLDWQPVAAVVNSLIVSVSGGVATFAGTVIIPLSVTVLANGGSFTYTVQATDTLATIASAVAALVAGSTAAGAAVTFPSTARGVAVRIVGQGTGIQEVRRQRRNVQVTIWAPSPSARDALARVIDPALAQLHFITLPDSTAARLIYQSSPWMDDAQLARMYRRDLIYSVEYATTVTEVETQIGSVQINGNPSLDGSTIVQTVTTFQ
jgi:hypothetical protein